MALFLSATAGLAFLAATTAQGTGLTKYSGAALVYVGTAATRQTFGCIDADGTINPLSATKCNWDMSAISTGCVGLTCGFTTTNQQRFSAANALGGGDATMNRGWHWVFFSKDDASALSTQIKLYVDSATEVTYGGSAADGVGTGLAQWGGVSAGYRCRKEDAAFAEDRGMVNGAVAYLVFWRDHVITPTQIQSILDGTLPSAVQTDKIIFSHSLNNGTTVPEVVQAGYTLRTFGSPNLRQSELLPRLVAGTPVNGVNVSPIRGLTAIFAANRFAYSDDGSTAMTDGGLTQRWDDETGVGWSSAASLNQASGTYKPIWVAPTAHRGAYLAFGVEPQSAMDFPTAVGAYMSVGTFLADVCTKRYTFTVVGGLGKPASTGQGGLWLWPQTFFGCSDFRCITDGTKDSDGAGTLSLGWMGVWESQNAALWANDGTTNNVGELEQNFGVAYRVQTAHAPTGVSNDQPGAEGTYDTYWAPATSASGVAAAASPAVHSWRGFDDTHIRCKRNLTGSGAITRTSVAAYGATNTAWFVGAQPSFGSAGYQYCCNMNCQGIAVHNRGLSDDETEALHRILGAYFNVNLNPDKVAVKEGSSSSAGYMRTRQKHLFWNSNVLDGVECFEIGRGGDDATGGSHSDIDSPEHVLLRNACIQSGKTNVYICQIGNNDVNFALGGADNSAAISAAILANVQGAKTAGFQKVAVITIQSRKSSPAGSESVINSRRGLVNATTRTLLGTTIDRVIDFGGAPGIGADNAWSGGVLYAPDQVHWNDVAWDGEAQTIFDGQMGSLLNGLGGGGGANDSNLLVMEVI